MPSKRYADLVDIESIAFFGQLEDGVLWVVYADEWRVRPQYYDTVHIIVRFHSGFIT